MSYVYTLNQPTTSTTEKLRICIINDKKQYSGTLCTSTTQFCTHLAAILVLSTTRNDQFCIFLDDESSIFSSKTKNGRTDFIPSIVSTYIVCTPKDLHGETETLLQRRKRTQSYILRWYSHCRWTWRFDTSCFQVPLTEHFEENWEEK